MPPARGKHPGPSRSAGGDRDLAGVGALVADRARCQMLVALGDGRSLPAGRLAAAADVSASTASGHLRKLVAGGLLVVENDGRRRNYRLADPEVAVLIEALERPPSGLVLGYRRACGQRVPRTRRGHDHPDEEDTMGPDRIGPHRVRFSFDGAPLEAARGMTIGAALLAGGIVSWRRAGVDGRPRGIFCGTGGCFDCLVDVGDRQAVRACLILVGDGDEVRTSVSRRAAG